VNTSWRGAALGAVLVVGLAAGGLAAQGTEVKYVRDSEAYAVLTRQVFRAGLDAVQRRVADAGEQGPWAVVLDVDETALDNSTYQLEIATYGTVYDDTTWNAWVARREAGVVPGVVEFIAAVRRLGGRVAFVSNRFAVSREDTRANLESVGLWQAGDLLCLQDGPNYSKADRRAEIAAGAGRCAWAGTPMAVMAFVGDQLGDFPADGEPFPQAGDDQAFGSRFFLLPNPMYGPWSRRVTRVR